MIIRNKVLTLEDVRMLNSEPKSMVILKNTVGQNANIIEQISNNVTISVIGGYDAKRYDKYKEPKYVNRTLYSPKQLAKIIRTFEKIEKHINPNWTDIEKALYVYLSMIKSINYDYKNKNSQTNSNLCVMLHRAAKCAGFATCYKEAMDRLGIENEFKNVPNIHSYNAVLLGGRWRVIDVTWGRNAFDENTDNSKCLRNFGLDKLEFNSSALVYYMCTEPQHKYVPFHKDEVLDALDTLLENENNKTPLNDAEISRA